MYVGRIDQKRQVEVSDALPERTEAIAWIWWTEVSNTLAEGLNSVTVSVEKKSEKQNKNKRSRF